MASIEKDLEETTPERGPVKDAGRGARDERSAAPRIGSLTGVRAETTNPISPSRLEETSRLAKRPAYVGGMYHQSRRSRFQIAEHGPIRQLSAYIPILG
jgi:hypothetical protein